MHKAIPQAKPFGMTDGSLGIKLFVHSWLNQTKTSRVDLKARLKNGVFHKPVYFT